MRFRLALPLTALALLLFTSAAAGAQSVPDWAAPVEQAEARPAPADPNAAPPPPPPIPVDGGLALLALAGGALAARRLRRRGTGGRTRKDGSSLGRLSVLVPLLGLLAALPATAQTHTPTTFASVTGPRQVTQLADGTVLVAEYGGNRVSAYPAGGGVQATFATGGAPTSAFQLADGTVLVAEYDAGIVAAYPAAGGVANRTIFASGLGFPYGITQLSDGTVLVTEFGNNRVSSYPATGGNANRADFAASIVRPVGVTQLSDGTVLVSTYSNGRVSAYPATGGDENQVDFATGLSQPDGMTQLPDGTVLIAERVNGRVSTFPASGGNANRSDFATGLVFPTGVTQLADGTILVSEIQSGHVLRYGLTRRSFTDGMTLTTGVTQLADGRVLVADLGSGVIREIASDGTETSFATVSGGPEDIIELPNGVVLVSLFNSDAVAAFDASGTRLTPDYATGLSGPIGFGVLPDGRVVVVERAGGRVTVVADANGGRITPSTYFSGLSGPHGLVGLDDGRVVVTEAFANRVSVISDATGTPLPSPSPLVSSLSFPTGITQLGDGRILVSEYNDSELTVFAPNGSGRTQFAGGLARPRIVTQLADGRVLVAQEQISGPGTGQVTEFGGLAGPVAVASTAAEGWRMLSAPVAGLTVGSLTDLNLVSGIPGDPLCAAGIDNLFTGYAGGAAPGTTAGYILPDAYTDALASGRGFFWYFWDDPADGGGPCGSGVTASSVQPLPVTLSASGVSPSADVTTTFSAAERAANDDTFYLAGNPFAEGIDLDGTAAGLTTVTATDQNGPVAFQNTVQIWNATTGGYVTRTAAADGGTDGAGGTSTADDVSVWQGVWLERRDAASPAYPLTLTYDAAYRTGEQDSGVFVGKTEGVANVRTLRFEVVGTVAGKPVYDGAASVLFADGATAAWDAYDASKLGAFSSPYALLAPVGQDRDGVLTQKAAESLPYEADGSVEVPLSFFTSGGGTFELRWPETASIPQEWLLGLTDAQTGQTVDLRAAESYAFESDATTDWSERFTVTVSAPFVGTEDLLADGYLVGRAYPNPTRSVATVSLEVAEAQPVRAEVFNVLGQLVATVLDGPVAPGSAVLLSVDTSQLAAGNYIVRVVGDTFVESRRLTVVR